MLGRLGTVFFMTLAFAMAFGDKVDKPDGRLVCHISFQGTTQLRCKVTHKATPAEKFILVTCDYRCDNPVDTIDAKNPGENIYCRTPEASPPGQGQNVITDPTD